MDFVTQLETDFRQQADRNIAVNQEAYLQNQFELYRLPTPFKKRDTETIFVKRKPSKQKRVTPYYY